MRNTSSVLLRRILTAIGSSTVVLSTAACGGEAVSPSDTNGSDSGASDGSTDVGASDGASDAGPMDAAPDIGANLPAIPVPDGGYPQCVGESTDYTGPCCDEVYCFTPAASDCPASMDVSQSDLGVYAPGSGTCECGRAGPFNSQGSEAWTEQSGACCYVVGTQSCMGRPLTVDGLLRMADIVSQPGWIDQGLWGELGEDLLRALDVEAIDSATRRRLAELWARDAQHEHASVASFNRFSLKLLALGAPAKLVEASQQAALDEVRHARACLVLASAYAGRALAPGPLSLDGDVLGDDDLVRLVVETVKEGCIGETLASYEASMAVAQADKELVQRTYSMIADDEARHAELAWAFVRWAIDRGGDRVRRAAREAFEQAWSAWADAGESRPDREHVGHGRLTERERSKFHRQGVFEVVRPAADALLAA